MFVLTRRPLPSTGRFSVSPASKMKQKAYAHNLFISQPPCRIKGRGKSVIAEAVIPPGLIKQYLKVDVDALIEVASEFSCSRKRRNLSEAKLDVGSEVAGALGGKNAHAANMVAAMFLATGQVP